MPTAMPPAPLTSRFGKRALAVDQRQAHGEILRHAHQRVVHRLVAVRVIFADDVADHARRLAVRLVPLVAVLVHRIEDAPVHRFEPVARIRQRPRHDHAHSVIEIALLHLLCDRDGANVGGTLVGGREIVVVGHVKPCLLFWAKIPHESGLNFIADRGPKRHLYRPLADGIFYIYFKVLLRELPSDFATAWCPSNIVTRGAGIVRCGVSKGHGHAR